MVKRQLSRRAAWTLPVLGAVVLFTMTDRGGASSSTPFTTVVKNPPPGGGSSNPSTFTVNNIGASPLGSVRMNGSTACAWGAVSAASCKSYTVSCPGVSDIDVTLASRIPTGIPKGTIIFASGGAGSGFLNVGAEDYVRHGFRVVQVGWAGNWAQTNGAGLKAAACRPATIFMYVFQSAALHNSSRTTGFCGQGSSGGGAQLAYSLTQYGLADYFDHLVIAAGPAVARLDYGCDPPLYTASRPRLCPLLPDAPFVYTSQVQRFVNRWEHTSTCGSSNPPMSDISKWQADSVVAPGAKFSYPKTSISWFFCVSPATANESTGQGYFLIDAVIPKNNPPDVNCYSGVCSGEQVWRDPKALAATESNMMSQCVPNH